MTISQESSKQKDESVIDTSSPYFIHSSDHPGLVLVSKRLNGDNYGMWYRSMIIALTAKNKIGFVDGTIEPPSASKKPMDFALWVRCDKMVLSWLLNSVEPDLADGVVYAETSREVWEDLHDRFSQGNAPRIFQIKKAIGSHSQGSTSVSAYYTKLKSLWDELSSYQNPPTCSCGGMKVFNDQQDQDRIMQFLMGLHENFGPIRGQILLMNPLPTVRKAYSLIIQEEKQRELSNGVPENFSMAAATQSRFNNLKNTKVHCDYCDRDGHTITNCRTRLYHCNHCDKDGHTDEFCRKLHGNGSTGGRDNQKIVRGLDSRKGQRQSFSSSGRANTTSHPTAHAAQFKQPATEAAPTNSSDQSAHFNFSDQNILNGLTPDQYQQLAAAVSMVKSQSSSNAYANAAVPVFYLARCPFTHGFRCIYYFHWHRTFQ
ncbi:hypothetical protein RHSIM_Rhsim12G0120200 [Rhododendron simsii]|uniref:Retrotransposon Copia-like N-terminal domain-containing protein n=1 Tax=Rhododendron simsii TaxID=118357 RepID=A0A834G3K4_RHOSS|nr:hypothetical protein RHSIM_Rhsim12G0120200 [Rhododendron simsii]